jgi:hypothetical protein
MAKLPGYVKAVISDKGRTVQISIRWWHPGAWWLLLWAYASARKAR